MISTEESLVSLKKVMMQNDYEGSRVELISFVLMQGKEPAVLQRLACDHD